MDEEQKEFRYTPKVYPEIQLFNVEPRAPLFYGIDTDLGHYVETFGDVDAPMLRKVNGERYPEEKTLNDLLLSRRGAQFAATIEIEGSQDELFEMATEFFDSVPETEEYRAERAAIRGMMKSLKEIKRQKLAAATSADAMRALEAQVNAHITETDMPYFLALQSHPIVTPVAGSQHGFGGRGEYRYYSFNPLSHITVADDGAVSFFVRTPEEEAVRVDDAVRDGWAVIDVLFRAVEPQYDDELRELLSQNRYNG